MSQLIKTEQIGRVVIAHLDNPPHALMTEPMMHELDALVQRADADDGIGVVVLTGAHPERFLAHYDVAELLRVARQSPAISEAQGRMALQLTQRLNSLPGMGALMGRTPAAGLMQIHHFHDTLLRMGRSGVIYIAAINGATAGGGLELAMACDFRYIADTAEVAQPEVLLGFPPGGGGTQRMARLIGRAQALDIMLSGRALSPAEAEALGLVTGVVPHAGLMTAVLATARRLATRFKPAVGVIKRAVLEGGSLPLEQGLQVEAAGFLAMLGEPKVQEAMAAYVGYIERNGDLPAGDMEARRQLEDGEFVAFYGS